MSESKVRTKHYQVKLVAERCKGCGFCVEFCPRHILQQSEKINSKGYHLVSLDSNGECTGCNICSMVCPDFAISVTAE